MKGQLTEVERRVGERVAQGRRNDEITAKLGLSWRTVEWHFSKVYRKLRIRSRTELVLRIVEPGGPVRARPVAKRLAGAETDGSA